VIARQWLHRAKHAHERGQSMVEFAVAVPVLVLLIFGIIDGGRAIFAYNGMSEATRNVARVAVVNCFRSATVCANDVIAGVVDQQDVNLPAGGDFSIRCVMPDPYDSGGGIEQYLSPTGGRVCQPGDLVEVSVNASFTPVTPLVAQLFGTRTLSSTSRMEIIR
jgi:hypothetical protein